MGKNRGEGPGQAPTRTCLRREIDLYGQTIDTLSQLRTTRPLRVAVFSREHELMIRLAERLKTVKVYHVNGQREYPIPDVVIAEECTGPLTRAAELVQLQSSEQVAEVAEVEEVRLAAKQTFAEHAFRYGVRPGRCR